MKTNQKTFIFTTKPYPLTLLFTTTSCIITMNRH